MVDDEVNSGLKSPFDSVAVRCKMLLVVVFVEAYDMKGFLVPQGAEPFDGV